jgi:hypothetical protein
VPPPLTPYKTTTATAGNPRSPPPPPNLFFLPSSSRSHKNPSSGELWLGCCRRPWAPVIISEAPLDLRRPPRPSYTSWEASNRPRQSWYLEVQSPSISSSWPPPTSLTNPSRSWWAGDSPELFKSLDFIPV